MFDRQVKNNKLLNVINCFYVIKMEERKLEEVGKVAHYYKKIEVAIVDLKAHLSIGDRILIRGATTDFEQTVKSMQIQHENVDEATAGQSIGLKVEKQVREKDVVYEVVQ